MAREILLSPKDAAADETVLLSLNLDVFSASLSAAFNSILISSNGFCVTSFT